MSYLMDPIERMEARIDYWADKFDGRCQGCGEDPEGAELDCGPMGDGPALCDYCCGRETRVPKAGRP